MTQPDHLTLGLRARRTRLLAEAILEDASEVLPLPPDKAREILTREAQRYALPVAVVLHAHAKALERRKHAAEVNEQLAAVRGVVSPLCTGDPGRWPATEDLAKAVRAAGLKATENRVRAVRRGLQWERLAAADPPSFLARRSAP